MKILLNSEVSNKYKERIYIPNIAHYHTQVRYTDVVDAGASSQTR
jgi:hypothetical protein